MDNQSRQEILTESKRKTYEDAIDDCLLFGHFHECFRVTKNETENQLINNELRKIHKKDYPKLDFSEGYFTDMGVNFNLCTGQTYNTHKVYAKVYAFETGVENHGDHGHPILLRVKFDKSLHYTVQKICEYGRNMLKKGDEGALAVNKHLILMSLSLLQN